MRPLRIKDHWPALPVEDLVFIPALPVNSQSIRVGSVFGGQPTASRRSPASLRSGTSEGRASARVPLTIAYNTDLVYKQMKSETKNTTIFETTSRTVVVVIAVNLDLPVQARERHALFP